VPRGTYHLAGRPEAFSCAPGPAGWRFVSAALDLACDSTFRAVRFVVSWPGGAQVRGGGLRLDDGAPVLVWAPADDPGAERTTAAVGVLTPSPGSVVALLRSVAAPGEQGVAADLDVLRFGADALAGLRVRLRVARLGATRHEAPDGVLLDETWSVSDVDTGLVSEVHLAGDVVLHAAAGVLDDEVELADLDGPPSGAG
jgi:hypothetical protein